MSYGKKGGKEESFLHFIAYVAQGLVESSALADVKSTRAAAERMASVLSRLSKERGLRSYYDENWNETEKSICLTGCSQTALFLKRLSGQSGNPDYLVEAERLDEVVMHHQCESSTRKRIRGAIAGSYPFSGRYIPNQFPNWAAKFHLDSLMEYERMTKNITPWHAG